MSIVRATDDFEKVPGFFFCHGRIGDRWLLPSNQRSNSCPHRTMTSTTLSSLSFRCWAISYRHLVRHPVSAHYGSRMVTRLLSSFPIGTTVGPRLLFRNDGFKSLFLKEDVLLTWSLFTLRYCTTIISSIWFVTTRLLQRNTIPRLFKLREFSWNLLLLTFCRMWFTLELKNRSALDDGCVGSDTNT